MLEQISVWIQTIPVNSACWLLIVLFILLDVILGTSKAYIQGTLSSTIAREGLMHKMGFVGSLLLCNLIDIAQSITILKDALGFTVPVSILCSIMIISCEIMSIYENVKTMNEKIDLNFLDNKNGDD